MKTDKTPSKSGEEGVGCVPAARSRANSVTIDSALASLHSREAQATGKVRNPEQDACVERCLSGARSIPAAPTRAR